MKKITEESIEAFLTGTPFKKANMSVEVSDKVTTLLLHGNVIAKRELTSLTKSKLSITNAGWKSNTTKERLNGLPNVRISQRQGTWYLNGTEWNGEWTEIKNKA